MKILVIGGQGLIGSAVCEHLAKEHTAYSYDLKTPDEMGTLDQRYDAVVDCARYETLTEQTVMWLRVISRKCDKLILFSSIYGHKAPDFSMYDGTEIKETPLEYAIWKGGTEQATRYLAQKLKPWHIQVNCIAPGGVLDRHSDQFQDAYRESGGVSMIETKAILPVIDMLLHPDNKVNGQVITVDGGWSL
jgi:NAD(P)-dependent dehydrogenase (short-subunit alcohol dehydrogenase family)